MTEIHKRIADSFNAQGLMTTIGARLALVADGEVHIEMPFSIGLSQQHGYVHAGAVTSIVDAHKVVAFMQATIVNVQREASAA